MADWRQIQARIRKAKNAPDAHVKLSDLYERTHDAMVAWELAAIEEKASRNEEAIKWYTLSAERFRRPEWKKKAEEALTRLGAPIPETQLKLNVEENTESFHIPASPEPEEKAPLAIGEIVEAEDVPVTSAEQTAVAADVAGDADGAKKKRRRGRRGGRGRRKKAPGAESSLPNEAFAEATEAAVELPAPAIVRSPVPQSPRVHTARAKPVERVPSQQPESNAAPAELGRHRHVSPVEAPVRTMTTERSGQGRAGDPALASRMAQLESMLRRLLSSPVHKLDESDQAPAGPGVFLLSDSDQITSYYIESCQTLRVGLGNMARGGRGGKNPRGSRGYSDDDLKGKLAEHLGINESKVSQYMKDHCVIRWLQLDDDASHLAHFAIGVLRTPLNVD